MKKIIIPVFSVIAFFCSCAEKQNNTLPGAKKINRVWLDSIVQKSDSTYSKPYKRPDFVTAHYYIIKKDSTLCQVMKDSADSIRQIIIAKKNIRTFFSQYYSNGTLQADLPLDEFGQYHGTGTFYFEDGSVQSTGNFTHGFKTGPWKVYDEKGKLTATDNFDNNGQLIQPQHP